MKTINKNFYVDSTTKIKISLSKNEVFNFLNDNPTVFDEYLKIHRKNKIEKLKNV